MPSPSNPDPAKLHFAMPIHVDFVLDYAVRKGVAVYWDDDVSPESCEFGMKALNEELGVAHLKFFFPKVTCYGYCRPNISLYTNYDIGKEPFATKEKALEMAEKIRQVLRCPNAPAPAWFHEYRYHNAKDMDDDEDEDEYEDDEDVRVI